MLSEEEEFEESDYASDTGFDSQGSSVDEVVEELEERGIKRKHVDQSESESNNKRGKKLRKLRKENEIKKLHKPPTADELNRLRETENLFHSNLFRLQIEEMLKEVQIKQKHKIEFELWYEKFSDWVLKAEDNENKYDIHNQEWLKKFNIKIPISQTPFIVKGTYQFKKPSKISIIGSYAANLVLGPQFVVDVMVEMPESFFQKEDYLNCRYHRKRALYMCELIHHIQLLPDLVEDVNFIAEDIDSLKPRVEIIPFGKFSKYVTVLLHFNLASGTYKLNRFSPSKNNVRWKWYFKENENISENIQTPFYNSTVAADLIVCQNMKLLTDTLSLHKNIVNGIILLKIWLRQRDLHKSIGGFNGFIISLLVCYLLKIKKLNMSMSSYQVFRNVCHYLISCDWTTNGITLCDTNEDENLPTMLEFHENYKVVFVDITGYHNLTYAVCPSVFKKIQHEAQLALNWLNDPNVSSFQALFITKTPFYQHYDHMVIFHNGEALENIADLYCSKEAQLNHCGIITPLVRDSIIDLLKQGFGKRVAHVHVKLPSKNQWKIKKKCRQALTITIGINLDPENYFSVVDKAAESETDEFRQFWGTKSELRRFQDGSITEAVVWSGRTLAEKRLICKEVLTHLLKLKFGLEPSDFHYVADQLDLYVAKDVEESSLKVSEAFDQLTKQLRNLNDLPLDVVSVQGTSPVFRYTDAFPPVPQTLREGPQGRSSLRNYGLINVSLNSCPPWVSPVDVTVQMMASNKWPQDLEAIRRIKSAFNIKISESLVAQYGLTSKAFQDRVEVVQNGFVFRIWVVYPNEFTLLKQSVDSNDGLLKYKDTEKSLALEKKFIHLPKLSSALHGLYQEHNSFGPACGLIKRWISSHLIDEHHVSEESVELLVATLYVRPQPHEPPQQPQVAFLRFHQLMTTTNWNTDCVILNLNNELTRPEIIEIESEFNLNRQSLPAVFIATPYDKTKSLWTKDSPTPLILLRLIELCANALRIIENQIYSKALHENQIIFEPCLDSYDVLITLNDRFNPRKYALTQRSTNHMNYIQKLPIHGFDPVSLYLNELREGYSDSLLFFRDTYGGSVIAGIWKPNALEPCDVKVLSLAGRKYNHKIKKLELNKEAILEDFWIIGKKLVKKIQVRVNGTLEVFAPF